MSLAQSEPRASSRATRTRIAFLGTGWIGLNRMEAIVATGACEVVALADPSPEMCGRAQRLAPDVEVVSSLDDILALQPDGIVIATPSALHAEQSIAALEAGIAVFCQKPLGRTAEEVRAVVSAAEKADRLLGVDLSYRFTEAMQRIREIVRAGEFGQIFSASLTFHNAYGPDKPWFHDKALSGGGCVIDLGVHLADLALWTLDFPSVESVDASLFREGRLLKPDSDEVEDFAFATIGLAGGPVVRLACSWHLHAGQDAVIGAEFYGTQGGASFHNVDGSFFDFRAQRYSGTSTEVLTTPPDHWGGRAACDWARCLASGEGFHADAHRFVEVAELLDRLYGRGDHDR